MNKIRSYLMVIALFVTLGGPVVLASVPLSQTMMASAAHTHTVAIRVQPNGPCIGGGADDC